MTLYEDLKWRGLIKDISSPELVDKLNNGSLTFYIGTDPTADSMHIGHFSSFLITKRLKDAGHNPILLMGGATALIGDPKPNTERPMIKKEEVEYNYVKMKAQAEQLFGCEVVNNYDWSKDINFIDYLRDYGKYFTVNYMISKDIVSRRIESGITYTEFSYMIMQALDFLYLYEHNNCVLQVAGQDQWGNITAGLELIRKKTGQEAYGFTMPLLTDANGVKIGKSEGNATWLDADKTSPYELYQYLYNTADSIVVGYLKYLTFLSKSEIEALAVATEESPEQRLAQKALAFEVIKFIHGEAAANEAVKISEETFTQGYSANMPTAEVNVADEINILDLLLLANLVSTKSEARRLVEQNGIKVNEQVINNVNTVYKNTEIDNMIIQKGKKTYLKLILC